MVPEINQRYKCDPFATHQPILIEVLKKVRKNIIELGCGHGSTLLIKHMLKPLQKLVSIESDYEWYAKYRGYADENHSLYYVHASNDDINETGEKWVKFIHEKVAEIDFELVFIDQSPWTARSYCLNYFKNKAKYIMVHDVDYFPSSGKWGTIISSERKGKNVKFEMDFSDIAHSFRVYYPPYDYFQCETGPPTLLCSNLVCREELQLSLGTYYR
ncbi:hypothetical protein ACFL27_26615 [candidate division CSSED10-310 bacterium]|uniref:Class I SAM-dependent methyltransferase n=1 Tax=candidate division CSSED10-310 bacterium TaxID=2855610 RepID=A0ABV6Z5P6_UNCC1